MLRGREVGGGDASPKVTVDPQQSWSEDATHSHEEALLRIYQRLRPGNPPQLEKARTLFDEKFFDVNQLPPRPRGRFRINRKLQLDVTEKEMTLRPELIASVDYLVTLSANMYAIGISE